MVRKTARRLLTALPVLLAVWLLAFILLNEPPDAATVASLSGSAGTAPHPRVQRGQLARWRDRYGYDKPVFYFSLKPASLSDSLRLIPESRIRQSMRSLSLATGAGEQVYAYYRALMAFQDTLHTLAVTVNDRDLAGTLLREADMLFSAESPYEAEQTLGRLDSLLPTPLQAFEKLKTSWLDVRRHQQPWRSYLPAFRWHPECRFHAWLAGNSREPGLLLGSLGRSFQDGRPVVSLLLPRLTLTLILSIFAILLAAIPSILMVYVTWRAPSQAERVFRWFVYGLYAMPSFVMGSLLIVFLTGGRFADWFPAYGSGDWSIETGLWGNLARNLSHFVLPVFCWTYGGFCYLYLQGQRSLKEAENEPWFVALRAKGLSPLRIFFRHVLPVVLIPVVTLLGQLFPALVGGSVVLEVLFSLPGMGELTYHAVLNGDIPVLLAVLLVGSLVTLVSFLISDLLVLRMDPRSVNGNKEEHP